MCYRPIHINNPIKDYNPHIDSASLDVPCGHCPDCVAKRKDEWFVRLYYEFVETKNLGGYTIYLTLSYRNEDLPLYNGKLLVPSSTYKNKSVLSFETITKRSHQDADGIAVFQRKDLTTWTKSIKNRLLTAAKRTNRKTHSFVIITINITRMRF